MADNPGLEVTPTLEEAPVPPPANSEIQLHDEKNGKQEEFQKATLELNDNPTDSPTAVTFAGGARSNSMDAGGEENAQPFSRNSRPGSAFGRKSAASVGSRTSRSTKVIESPWSSKMYFSYKEGSFEHGVEVVRNEVLKPDMDGDLTGAWLLTEIDHWNHDKEILILLSTKSMFICKYNFITNKLMWYRRIMLNLIERIVIGDIVFPKGSLMPPREHGGYRLYWGKEELLTFGQRWNPMSSDIPFITLAHHHLIYNKDEQETITYNVDDFYESLMQATVKVYKEKGLPSEGPPVEESPITVYCYASLSSLVFNQSFLGFNRDRNGVSF